MQNQMPKNWQKVKLGDIAVVNMGQSPRSEFYNVQGEGIPFYQGVTDFGEKYPTPNMYCSDPIKRADPGTVLFSVRAPVGETNIANEEICIGRGVASLSMKNGNNEFLYPLLKSQVGYFKAVSGGTTYESINKDQIEDIEIVVPIDLEDQKRVASILSAFDDKIEVNNKIARTLEEMAQTLFKWWFVKNALPSWEVSKFENYARLEYGKALQEEKRIPGKVLVFGSSGQVGTHKEKLCSGPGIVVGRKGNVGSVFWVDDDFYPIDTTFYVRSKISLYYVYFVLKNMRFHTGDSAVPGLNRESVHSLEILVPDEQTLKIFRACCSF